MDKIVTGKGGILDLWKLMNISNDRFVRTTDDYHVKSIQYIFRRMYENGDIYKGAYKGLYCTPCETSGPESACRRKVPRLRQRGRKCGEEAYFFRLSSIRIRSGSA